MRQIVVLFLSLSVIGKTQVPVSGRQAAPAISSKRITPIEAEATEKSVRVALLVGVGEYDRDISGLAPLKYPVADVEGVGRVLKKDGYSVRLLTDRAATAGGIRQNIKELTKAVDRDEGTFLFMFSGHGGLVGKENYLATFGTTSQDLAVQGLSLSELKALLQSTGAKQRIAFLDACRDEPGKGSTALAPMRDTKDSEGLRILYSTALGDVSYEDDSLQHGVFSSFLIAGLEGKAVNPRDGLITFDDLSDFVTREMRQYGISRPGAKLQIPYQLGESAGDFLIVKPNLSPATPGPLTFQPPVNSGLPQTNTSDMAIYQAALTLQAPDQIEAEAAKISNPTLAGALRLRAQMLRSRPNARVTTQDTSIRERQRADAAFSRGQYYAALPVYQQLAEAGDSTAMAAIGTMYEKGGEGLPKDVRQAAQWHLKAAEAGNSAAMQTIGLDYFVGQGVPLDYAKAAVWLKQAAEAGQTTAMGALGVLYGYGRGVPKDLQQAAFWLRKSLSSDDPTVRQGSIQQLQKLGLSQ